MTMFEHACNVRSLAVGLVAVAFGLAIPVSCTFESTVGDDPCLTEGARSDGRVCRDGYWVEVDAGGREAGDSGGIDARIEQCKPSAEVCNNRDDDCDKQVDEDCGCKNGESRPCYSGPSGKAGVGMCSKGTQTCRQGAWGACSGDTLPKKNETCGDQVDNDCDGTAEEGCECQDGKQAACYSGPSGTRNTGLCRDGTKTCSGGSWGMCQNDRTPAQETCGDGKDNDCDGGIDEDCRCDYKGKSQGVCAGQTPGTSGTCPMPSHFEQNETTCDDGRDNDCDGETDESAKDGGETCSSDCECFSGSCHAGRCDHRIFVASGRHNGALGGHQGADRGCNTIASKSSLAGQWKAVLSTDSLSARDHLSIDARILNMNGAKIADDRSDLWDGNIDTAVAYDQNGNRRSVRVWTGATRKGGTDGETCDDWRSSRGYHKGEFGRSDRRNHDWLHARYDPSCSDQLSIYCIDGQ